MPAEWIIPELDVVIRAFSRQAPEPTIASRFADLIDAKCLLIPAWIRQNALAMTRSEAQLYRLADALSVFPDAPVTAADHLEAALRQHRLAGQAQAQHFLLWVLAERIGARIWSYDPRWRRLQHHGAPVIDALQGA